MRTTFRGEITSGNFLHSPKKRWENRKKQGEKWNSQLYHVNENKPGKSSSGSKFNLQFIKIWMREQSLKN